MSNRKKLGQFFTTNVSKILAGFEDIITNKEITDPFAGNGDLLDWAKEHKARSFRGYDIDKKLISDKITHNDSLLCIPPSNFILTNPPYLGKNKMTKVAKKKYMDGPYEDFYMLAMKRIIESECYEGIVIIPVNFFSAENSDGIRKEFLSVYQITKVRYFKFQVFDDTTYNVVAFHFTKNALSQQIIPFEILSSYEADPIKLDVALNSEYDYRIGGEELSKITPKAEIKITRLTIKEIDAERKRAKRLKHCSIIGAYFNDKNTAKEYKLGKEYAAKIRRNVILLNCIDTNANKDGWINAEDITTLGKECLVGKSTSRNIAFVLFPDEPSISLEKQREIIKKFNETLNKLRDKYHSLFLTNFRDNDRKRVSFDFCYRLLSHLCAME